ncbi:MAG: histidine phosphatase family protein [Pseudomonadota bacterium]
MNKTATWLFAALSIALIALVPSSTRAQNADVLQLLKQPGVHALMRHALAPGGGDPANFQLNECSTQRNLDDSGRDQARDIGAAFRTAGITFTKVLTSQWCRCRETAELLDLGKPADFTALNSFFQDRSTGPAQVKEVRDYLKALPPQETAMLVTHQVNVTGLTGEWVRSGEVFIIKVDEAGEVKILGRYLIPAR